MGKTKIEWCDRTINPIRARIGNEVFFDAPALAEALHRKIPTRFFWCDMTDIFGEWVKAEWITDCFSAMAATPHHTHLVLTKRPQRIFPALYGEEGRYHFDAGDWPSNVWIGVSVENQLTADQRIPSLMQIPAAVRWLSAEPLLAPIDLSVYLRPGAASGHAQWLAWMVIGGESGPDARPCNLAWIRSITRQCRSAGVPVFTKQIGSRWYDPERRTGIRCSRRKGGDMIEWPEELRIREYPRVRRPDGSNGGHHEDG